MLAACLTLAVCAPVRADEPAALDDGLAIVGLIVGDKEQDAVDAFVEGGYFLLPMKATFTAVGTELRETETGRFLDTPIGTIDVPADAIREQEGEMYVVEAFLEGPLTTKVTFDEESYALIIEPPWKPGAKILRGGSGNAEDVPELVPDVVPPVAGVTSVHGDIFSNYSTQGSDPEISTQLEVNGHAAGGVWRARYAGDLNNYELAEYAWLRELNEKTWLLLGRQQVSVHPQVDSIDMTGAQIAWSNRPRDFEQIEEVSGVLLDRTGGAGRRFVGDGPPGGRVELVIDGLLIAETQIDVNGVYRIENPLLGDRRNDIELRVFEPLSDNQVDTITLTVTANRLLAPKGSINVVAGAGLEGNFLDIDGGMGGPTGFVRARYAPFDDITLEAAAVYDPDDGIEGSVGAAAQLGKFGSVYAGAGMQDDGTMSFDGLYYGSFGKLSINARTSYRQAPDQGTNDRDDQGERADDFDHVVDVNYDYSARLRFGAIARHNVDATFVLPYVSWKPHRLLSLAARPNRAGEYRFEARAAPFKDIDLIVFYEGAGFARIAYNFETEATGSSSVSLDADYDPDKGGFGVALGLNGSRLFGLDARWRLRAARNEESNSASFGISHELKPGISVYADGGARLYDDEREADYFGKVGVSFDLGIAGGSITAAPRRSTSPRYGRLAGKIVVPDGIDLTQEDIVGANVVVDGQPVGRVNESGEYWLPRIPKGVHSVRLEADTLPIDLVVDTDTTNAKVAPGAVTVVNFGLAVEVGAAGRITGPDGKPVKDVPLQIVTQSGEVITRGKSNTFGLFRMDGLRPGTYTLRAVGRWDGAQRPVVIGTEYAFGTDLTVDTPKGDAPKAAPERPVTRP